MSYKIYIPFLLLILIALKKTFYIPQPSSKNPSFFLSNQSQIDLKLSLIKSLNKAEKEIFISIYTLTDPDILKILNKKASEGKEVQLIIDKKHFRSTRKKLSKNIDLKTIKQSGLMHQKVFIIDNNVYIGSSNLTSSSLRMHDNLMLGIYHPLFAEEIKEALLHQETQKAVLTNAHYEFYTLPSQKALKRVLGLIDKAQESIYIAMFTFTHQDVFKALVKAKERGVKVKVIIDALSTKGASKKMATMLKEAQIETKQNRGIQLMHHKFALIDHKTFIMGSTNWTKSAFEKNRDCLLILPQLNVKDQNFLKKLWRNLDWEAKAF